MRNQWMEMGRKRVVSLCLISNVDMMILSSLNSEIGSIEITRKRRSWQKEPKERKLSWLRKWKLKALGFNECNAKQRKCQLGLEIQSLSLSSCLLPHVVSIYKKKPVAYCFVFVCALIFFHIGMALHWLVQVFLLYLSSASLSSSSSMKPKCQSRCGNISIPYPFGMGQDASCFRNHWFNMTCHEYDTLTPPKALLLDTFEVLDISLQGQLRIKFPITWVCYSQHENEFKSDEGYGFAFKETPYTFSNTHNKFTAIGCDTLAYAKGLTNTGVFESGCVSYCSDTNNVINGSCTGIGCCQSSIQAGLQPLTLQIHTIHNHINVSSFNPCSYAFLADQDFNFNFSVSDLLKTNFLDRNKQVPAVVDWMAEWNETCQEATRNKADYACLSENSECYNITINGPGYSCRCSPGYQGNPFVPGGCQGIWYHF